MILKTTTPLLDLDGKPFKDGATVRSALVAALLGAFQGETLTRAESLERFSLAKKIHDEDEAKLSAEDVVLAKAVVEKAYAPLTLGRLFEALEA